MASKSGRPTRRTFLALLAAGLARAAHADDVATVDASGRKVAIKGYDVVAYFLDLRPEKGDERYEYEWQGVWWRFASADHRDRFAAAPESYAPQFGGFCAAAMAIGMAVAADPEAWTIVDGKLYLNIDRAAREEWRQDVLSNIDKANQYWSSHRYLRP
jgi:hypothetical protein